LVVAGVVVGSGIRIDGKCVYGRISSARALAPAEMLLVLGVVVDLNPLGVGFVCSWAVNMSRCTVGAGPVAALDGLGGVVAGCWGCWCSREDELVEDGRLPVYGELRHSKVDSGLEP
jgi:hypothetical protein